MSIALTRHPAVRHPAAPEKRLVVAGSLSVSGTRRALDVLVSAVLLVLTAPLVLVAMAAILVTDGRPVFFRQPRTGEDGRAFPVLKLRSMRTCSGPRGAGVTTTGDDRVTPVGRVLRRTSIDELPQLWHVLRGQMTLVGPRPESVDLARRYPPSCRIVLTARPGLTGPAQLAYRERAAVPPDGRDVESWYLETLVPLRAQADLDYLCSPTLANTVRYLLRTAAFVTGLRDYERAVDKAPAPRTVTGSHRALTHSPVVRSNSKL